MNPVPNRPAIAYWRKNDAPIAVMNGTSRGAFRNGRYATRSSRTATPVDAAIAARRTMASDTTGCSVHRLVRDNGPATTYPIMPPTMNTSPWAKLMKRRTPYTIV